MPYIYHGQNTEGFPGVPARDLTDEEFAHYAAEYDAQFEPGALASSPLYEHVTKKALAELAKAEPVAATETSPVEAEPEPPAETPSTPASEPDTAPVKNEVDDGPSC